jgi:Ca2+-binding EF-hand superfamily protein
MGQGVTPERLKTIINEVDDNGNGEIEFVEYLKIMRNFYPWKFEDYEKRFYEPAKKYPEFSREDIDVFVEAFREYDTDSSGSIDAKELDVAFKRMGQGCTPEKLQQIIDEVDDNKNGVVEWPEFLAIMRKLYAAKFDDKYPNQQSKPAKSATTPVKSATPVKSTTPTKTPTSPTTPVKSTSTTTTTPAKSTTTTSTTPTKTTPTSSPSTQPKSSNNYTSSTSSSTTSSSTTPAKSTTPSKSSSFGAKPTTTTTTSSTLSSHRASNACASCGKTVYPIEEVRAMEQTYHKGCFRCQGEECNLLLSLKTFKGSQGKVYCQKHVPVDKPTSVPVSGNLATLNATNAPKLSKAQGIKKNERMTFAPGELKPSEGEGQQ